VKSKYLEAFQKLRAEGASLYQLVGGVILVEEAAKPEVTTKSGIILAESTRNHDGFGQNRPTLIHILDVGEGYYDDETGEAIPVDLQPGDICLTGVQSCKWLSHFGPIVSTEGARIGLALESEIQLRFRGPDAYAAACKLLESTIQKGAA
jgi:co-chaperonin GroES (HSP10)